MFLYGFGVGVVVTILALGLGFVSAIRAWDKEQNGTQGNGRPDGLGTGTPALLVDGRQGRVLGGRGVRGVVSRDT